MLNSYTEAPTPTVTVTGSPVPGFSDTAQTGADLTGAILVFVLLVVAGLAALRAKVNGEWSSNNKKG